MRIVDVDRSIESVIVRTVFSGFFCFEEQADPLET